MEKEILEKMSKYIDHSIIKADATKKDIIKFCDEAKKYHFAAVAINSSYISLVKEQLKDTNIKICGTAGYPLGANTTAVKVFEASECVKLGADELDTVMNIGYFLDKDYDYVINDLREVINEFKRFDQNKIVKVIIETSLIGENQIKKAVECAIEAGADYVKTSSGYGISGAKLSDVIEMSKASQKRISIKAAGGIKNLMDAYSFIEAGATRLGGTGGVKITEEAIELLKIDK